MLRGFILFLIAASLLIAGETCLFQLATPQLGSAYWLIPIFGYIPILLGGLFKKFPIIRVAAFTFILLKIAIAPFLLLGAFYNLPIFYILAIVIGLFLSLAFIHGLTRGQYLYQVTETILHFDDLPPAFDGYRFAQISDIHAGTFDNPEKVAKGIAKINALNPDLIVFTGDLVNYHPSEIEPYYGVFDKLEAPDGVLSVLGNHDYYQSNFVDKTQGNVYEFFKEQHRQTGFELLLDEHREIIKENQSIYILGVQNWGDPPFPQIGDLGKAAVGVPDNDFKILLSHDPTHWSRKVLSFSQKIHLTLSGHTHAMQFGINWGKIRWSPVSLRYKHWMGLYEEAGKYLYVNRGFGCLAFPGRVGMFPEISLFELRRK